MNSAIPVAWNIKMVFEPANVSSGTTMTAMGTVFLPPVRIKKQINGDGRLSILHWQSLMVTPSKNKGSLL